MHNYIKLALLSSIPLLAITACGGGSTGGSSSPQPAPSDRVTAQFVDTNDSIGLETYDVADTVFAGQTYKPKYIITNNGAQPVTFGSLNVTGSAVWTPGSSNCTTIAANGGTCTITGDFSIPNIGESAGVNIVLNGTDGTTPVYTHTQNVMAIAPAPSGYLAIRINYPTGGTQKVYAVVDAGGKMISFDSNHYGTVTNVSYNPSLHPTYAVEIGGSPTDSNVLYLPPYLAGGVVYLSLDNPDTSAQTRWQPFEYFNNTGALANINPTNVNRVALPVELSLVVSGERLGLAARTPAKYDMHLVPMSQVFNNMKNALSAYPDSWGSLVRTNSQGDVIAVLSAVNFIHDLSKFDVFYNPYINDVWEYYKTHNLTVDVSAAAAVKIPGRKCTVVGQVEADNLMHFKVADGQPEGNCPQPDMTGGYITDITFTKFQSGDFISAAGGGQYTTWGPNTSYRSVIGQNVVSAQSVGLLPYCSKPDFVYGKAGFDASKGAFYTPQYNCLANYSQYGNSVINQYMKQSATYYGYYNYGYSDVLGEDGALYDLNTALYPMTVNVGRIK